MMAKVLVVDDHECTRIGVRSILEECSHEVVECEGVYDVGIVLAECGSIDVALVDLLLEGTHTGLEVMSMLDSRRPRPKLVVLTSGETLSRPQLLCRAHLRYRLDGALPKRRLSRHLPASIDKVCSGQEAFHPDLVPFLARKISIDPLFQEKSHASLWVALAAGFGGGHAELGRVTGLSRHHVGNMISEMGRKLTDNRYVGEDELPIQARAGVLPALTRFATAHSEYILYWASEHRDRFGLAPVAVHRLKQYERGEI
jgi:DNA-binding NarL/FixJ family response regulator